MLRPAGIPWCLQAKNAAAEPGQAGSPGTCEAAEQDIHVADSLDEHGDLMVIDASKIGRLEVSHLLVKPIGIEPLVDP